MSVSLYLVRHGATCWNLERPPRLQGRGVDSSLAPIGRDQSIRVADELAKVGPTALFSSPLRRAIETAAILGSHWKIGVTAVEAFAEVDMGRWQGRNWDEIRADEPEIYEQFHAEYGLLPYPEGESLSEAAGRVVPVLESLATSEHGPIVVVAHHSLTRAAVAHWLGLPFSLSRSLRFSNAGITRVDFEGGPPRVVTINGVGHLLDIVGGVI